MALHSYLAMVACDMYIHCHTRRTIDLRAEAPVGGGDDTVGNLLSSFSSFSISTCNCLDLLF